MLLRCNVDDETGLVDLNQCRIIAAFFAPRGFKIGYAINRQGVDLARQFLGEDATIHRIPDELEADADRLGHLGRTHKHQNVIIVLRKTTSTYLFQVQRLFQFTAVVDRGSNFLVYANLLIDGRVSAPTVAYNCSPEAKLLLGPKFFICDPAPIPIPSLPEPPTTILVNIGNRIDLLEGLLPGLCQLDPQPEVRVLLGSVEAVAEAEELAQSLNAPFVHAILPDPLTPFSYHHYPLIITQASDLCLEFAHQGLCFVTLALSPDQLQEAYSLEQVGISPTLGWCGTKSKEEIRYLIGQLLADAEMRHRYSRTGRQCVDGQALFRMMRFVPPE